MWLEVFCSCVLKNTCLEFDNFVYQLHRDNMSFKFLICLKVSSGVHADAGI